MFARVSTYQGPPEGIGEAIRNWEDNILPGIRKQMEGSGIKDRGVILLVDRQSGKSLTISFWDTEEDMKSTEQLATQARGDATTAAGGEIVSVERYEVAIDDRQ